MRLLAERPVSVGLGVALGLLGLALLLTCGAGVARMIASERGHEFIRAAGG
jgi:hypothetical protein